MNRGKNSRGVTNAPWIPGDDIIVPTSQIAHERTVAKDEVDTGSTRTTCGTSEWGPLSGKR
jgi:hypothetical protein